MPKGRDAFSEELAEVYAFVEPLKWIRFQSLTPIQLRYLRGAFRMAILQCDGYLKGEHSSGEDLLTASEAAKRLRISVGSLYRRADEYPFVVPIGTNGAKRRTLRFSKAGIDDYLRKKGGDHG